MCCQYQGYALLCMKKSGVPGRKTSSGCWPFNLVGCTPSVSQTAIIMSRFVAHWKGKLFVDGALPFGLRSAPKIFTALADAL